jgi:hypothetical protein
METAAAALEQHYAIYDTSRGPVDGDAEEADWQAIMQPLYGACEGRPAKVTSQRHSRG